MSLDRQSIEKRDFPISRRGYETVAVDEHLAGLAAEVEALRAAAPAPEATASLATSASERIRGIVEAAETTAAEIERAAEQDAKAARGAADDDARATREAASSEAQAHVTAVQQATALMLERVGVLESEVTGLLSQLRASADSIGSGLTTLHAQVVEVGGLGSGAPDGTSEPAAPAADPAPVAASSAVAPPAPSEAETAPDPDAAPDAIAEPEPVVEPVAVAAPVADEEPLAPELPLSDMPAAPRSTDVAGARMVALNLVLDGVPRDEIEAHLDERYALDDSASLLDELYAKQGG